MPEQLGKMALYAPHVHQAEAAGKSKPDIQAVDVGKHRGQVSGWDNGSGQHMLVKNRYVIKGNLADK